MEKITRTEDGGFYDPVFDEVWYLYDNDVVLANGWRGKTYYFSKVRAGNSIRDLPEGYEFCRGTKNKFLFIRKIR